MDLKLVRCTTCGNQIKVTPDSETVTCDACGNNFLVSQGHELSKKEEKDIIQIKKLRENLERSIRIDDLNSILHFSQEILSIIPSDYRSGYFSAYATSKLTNPKALYAFYHNQNIEATDNEIDTVFDHLIKNFDLRDYSIVKKHVELLNPKRINQLNQEFDYRSRLEDHYANVPRDVFICHRSTDTSKAQEILNELESDGHQCWISNRNLRPNDNENYWKNISDAIENCSIFLVVSSKDSMLSKDVQREISIANKLDKARIEVKIDDSVHTTLFKHFFNGIKWINAISSLNLAKEELKQRVLDLELNSKKGKEIEFKDNKPTQMIQSAAATTNVGNLIKRMMMELESKNTTTAIEYAERILDIDVEIYDAWLVKFLVDNEVFSRGEFLRKIQTSTDLTYINSIKEQSNFSKMFKYSQGKSFETSIDNKITDYYRDLKKAAFSRLDHQTYKKLAQLLVESDVDVLALHLMNHEIGSLDKFSNLFNDFDNINLIASILDELKADKQLKSVEVTYQQYYEKLQQLITKKSRIEEEKRLEEERKKEEKRLEEQRIRNDFIRNIKDLLIAGDFSIALNQLNQTQLLSKQEITYCELNLLAVHKCSTLDEFFEKYRNEKSIVKLEELIGSLAYKNYLKASKNERILEFDKESKLKIEEYEIRLKQERKEQTIKKFKKSLWFVVPLLIIIIAVSILTPTVFIPASNYNHAMQLIDEGKFEEAALILSKIEGFSDSTNQITIVNAYQKFEEGNFEEAITLIEEIGEVEIQYDLDGGQNLNQLNGVFPLSISTKTPIKEGYTFLAWELKSYTINNEKGKYSAEVSLKAVWETKQYTITFNSNGGSLLESITQDYNTNVLMPTDPEKVGNTFDGWYLDVNFTTIYTFTTMPAENITVYAKWSINSYTLQFLDTDHSVILTDSFEYNADLSEVTPPVVSKVGYSFDGWDIELPLTMPAANVTLTATYTINQYTISFDTNDGSSVEPITQDYNTDVLMPANPEKVGNTFGGWYLDANFTIPYTFTTIPAEDITVYAKWLISPFTISIELNGGTGITSIYESYGTVIESPDVSKEGYSFGGWYLDASFTIPYTFTTIPAEDITVYANWTPISYEIIYDLNGGDNNIANPVFYTIETEDILLEIPTKEGYTFLGWYTDSGFTIDATSITQGSTGDVFLYANWGINSYEINYYTFIDYDPLSDIPLYLGEKIIEVSLGGAHSSAITSLGRIFTWGSNTYGELGDGTTIQRNAPIEITLSFNLSDGETIVQVSLGSAHSSAITSLGRIFTWGSNTYGELGDGTTINRITPIEITPNFNLGVDETIIRVSLGGSCSSAITSTGRLFTWGSNGGGQIGDGTTVNRTTPIEITPNFNLSVDEMIIQASFGSRHSSAITSLGRIYTWGSNPAGQLGLGDWTITQKNTPTEITSRFNLSVGETITQISLNSDQSSAVTSSGRLFTWGWNIYGQLGLWDGFTTQYYSPVEITSGFNLTMGETIVQVSLGGSHSSAITSTGRVFTWGYNYAGRLGDGTTENRLTPIEITLNFNLNVEETIILVSLGSGHSSAITSLGRIFTWGSNTVGQLGDKTTSPELLPINIKFYSPEYIHVETYNFNQTTIEYIPSKSGYSFDQWFSDVVLTNRHTFTSMPALDIILYGRWLPNTYQITYNLDGGINSVNNPDSYAFETRTIQLGSPTKEGYTFLGWYLDSEFTGNEVESIDQGSIGDISLYAKWEIIQYEVNYIIFDNDYDPLTDISLYPGETIESISLGTYHSSILTSNGRVFIWGLNQQGQLGNGTLIDSLTPIEITNQFNLDNDELIVRLALGGVYSTALTSNGRIFTWGANYSGQLGDGTTIQKSTPTEITNQFGLVFGETITGIFSGEGHSAALTSNNRLFTWGENSQGQLGDSTIINKSTPVDITNQFNLIAGEIVLNVFLGHYHSSAITSTGSIFTWGWNSDGQLGDGSTINKNHPVEITNQFNLSMGETIICVTGSTFHSSALTSTGRIFTWGRNSDGQLGDGTVINKSTPIEITNQFNFISGETISSVSVGDDSSSALTSVGRLFTWGKNDYGLLGDGTIIDKYIPIDITSQFSLGPNETIISVLFESVSASAITSSNLLFSWGRNDHGKLGDGTIIDRWIPTKIAIANSILVHTDIFTFGTSVIAYEPNSFGYIFNGLYEDTTFLNPYVYGNMPARDVYIFGTRTLNDYQIEYNLDGGINSVLNPDSYNIETSTINFENPIKEGYTFLGWYGNDSYDSDAVKIIEQGSIGNITLYAKWEINQYEVNYIIFNEDYNPLVNILLTTGEKIVNISLGNIHSAAITSEGRIFTWGDNAYSELGDGTTTDKYIPTEITSQFGLSSDEKIISISLGAYHSLAITTEGRVFSWGLNNYGQLGDGTSANQSTPIEITSQFGLNFGESITSISAGSTHSSAISSSGRVFIWGGNTYNQLGTGTTTNKYIPTEITGQFGLNLGETITMISLGGTHSSAITSEGRVFTWGVNGSGQLGDGTTIDKNTPTEITSQFGLNLEEKVISIDLGSYHSSAITSEGRVFTWGRNNYGELGDGTTINKNTPTEITSQFGLNLGEKIISIYLGSYHSSAITSEGRVYTWGLNSYGQLGDGSLNDQITPQDITNQFGLVPGETIRSLSIREHSSSAITSTGRVFTWGWNSDGQLGDGTTSDKSTPSSLSLATTNIIYSDLFDYNEIITEYTPILEGYGFSGWYTDLMLTIPYTNTNMPAEDIILYGKWTQD